MLDIYDRDKIRYDKNNRITIKEIEYNVHEETPANWVGISSTMVSMYGSPLAVTQVLIDEFMRHVHSVIFKS